MVYLQTGLDLILILGHMTSNPLVVELCIVVLNFLTLNQLILNIKETNFIIFKSNKKRLRRDLHLTLNGTVLQRVEDSKFLGIVIHDQHLTWKNHIDYITKKILRITGLLCRIHFYVNQTHLKMLYNSLIYPYLHYGNIVWANN